MEKRGSHPFRGGGAPGVPRKETDPQTVADAAPCQSSYPSPLPAAVEIPGRYGEIREYACGGIGRVLLVHDQDLGRDVALKELLVGAPADAATKAAGDSPETTGPAAARFLREARITGQLEHPSIVPVYELARRADGRLYYTMKLVRGQTLERAIADAGSLSERLGLLSHFLDLCHAIAYAHSRGVIHRDLKPANVMIGEFGETVVIDWGLACAKGHAEDGASLLVEAEGGGEAEPGSDRLTRHGRYIGTPHYMPPEQAQGALDTIAEPADIYALGAVLYELLSGARPFEGEGVEEIVARIVESRPVPVQSLQPDCPAELAAVCERAMQHAPEARYTSAMELAEEVERFQTGAMVRAYRYKPLERLRRFAWRYRAILATAAVALTLFAAAGVFAFLSILQEQARTERALYHSSISWAKAAIDSRRLADAHQALTDAPKSHRGLEWGLLWRLSHPELVTLRRHSATVDHGVFSPDGTKILTGGRDGRAIVWDARRPWETRNVFVDLDEPIHRVAWSADGALLATCTDNEEISIWDASDFGVLQEFTGYAPVFGPDSQRVAAATGEGQMVTVYGAVSGAVLHKLVGPSTHMIHIAFSNDGKRVAAAVGDGSVWLWDLESGPAWHSGTVHATSARFVAFSPDDTLLLTAGADHRARLWNTETGAQLRVFEGHAASIHGAAFAPGGQRFFTCGDDRTVRVWDAAAGTLHSLLDGFSEPLKFLSLSPDATRFLTHAPNNEAIVRLAMTLKERHTFRDSAGPVNSVAFGPNGRLLAAGAGHWRYQDDDRIIIWDKVRRKVIQAISTGSGPVHCVRFFADGERIAAGNQDGTASVYDIQTGERLHVFPGHTDTVWSIAISPDGQSLATASWDGSAVLWDVSTGKQRARLAGDPRRLDVVAFNPSGDRVATGGMDGIVRFWDTTSGQETRALRPEVGRQRVSALAFSRDGRRLVTGGNDGIVTLWDLEKRREVRRFRGHAGIVYAVALSADGRRLITGGNDASVRIWDTQTGRQLLLLDQHKGCVNSLALSPDERFLATGSDDASAVLWPILPWSPAK